MLHAVAFLFFASAVCLWALAIRNSFSPGPEDSAVPMAVYFGLVVIALVFSSVSIMARTGARWAHVSFFMFFLPAVSILVPIAGTAVCVYCLRRVSGSSLPELKLGGHRRVRSGARPPSRNAGLYRAVPLHKSGAAGILILSFVILTHVFIVVRGIVGLVVPLH